MLYKKPVSARMYHDTCVAQDSTLTNALLYKHADDLDIVIFSFGVHSMLMLCRIYIDTVKI